MLKSMINPILSGKKTIILLILFVIFSIPILAQTKIPSEYIVRTFIDDDGNSIDEIIVPGRPPKYHREPAVELPDPALSDEINILSNVPAFDWSYGCSATSGAMIAGFYDNGTYPNMYTGPTNGGVVPMNNSIWGSGECPLSATHQGYDGLSVRGHVDDYWYSYGSTIDPYYGNWTEHGYADCTADYMGTNQYYNWQNTDGSTTFYYYTNGSPIYNYTGCEPDNKDGCHGLREFFESRGYSIQNNGNYSQYIYGYLGNTLGFTFNQFKAEIDAGRPVIIQVAGHSMVGFGYNDSTNLVYIHDTWDYSNHTMTWGGSYSGMQHYGMSVFILEPETTTLNPPENLNVTDVGYATWDAPAGSVLFELIQHDGNPQNAYYQAYNNGYGVVYNLSGYTDVTLEMVDFRHSPWGTYGTWNYSIHIVDWNTQTELLEVSGLQTTGNDIWEEGIALGSVPESGLVGIFMEPMSNSSVDAYPCLDSDDVGPNGLSFWGPLSNYSGMTLSTIGDFLMDLWIMADEVDGVVKAPRFAANFGNAATRLESTIPSFEFITPEQTSRELQSYNVYLDGNQQGNTDDTFWQYTGLTSGVTYTAGVSALYDEGESNIIEEPFTYIQLTADFYADITSGNTPLTVNFTDLSTGYPASWEWDFDNDGTIDSYEQNPQWTYYERGNYTVTLSVFDGIYEDTETKDDYISLLNSAPIIQYPLIDFSFDEDTSDNSIDLFSVFDDPDLPYGDSLSFSYSGNDSILVEILNGLVTLTPLPDWFGAENITFIAFDDSLVFISDDVLVTIINVNDPPVINFPANFTFNEDSFETYDFTQYITDIDNSLNELSLSWSGNDTINIIQDVWDITFSSNVLNWNGMEEVTFFVDDNSDNIRISKNHKVREKLKYEFTDDIVSETIDVICLPVNDPPTIVLPDYFTFAEDSTLVVDFSVYIDDIDPDELTLSVTGNLEITVDITGTIVTFGASENWNGTETLTFTVDDNQTRATASDSVDVIVTPVNDPPTIVLPDYFTFAEDSTLVEDFSVYIADVDPDELALSVTGNIEITVDITGTIVTFGAAENWNGTELLTFTVDDNQTRATASDSVDVIVTPVNDPPTIVLPDYFTFAEDSTLVEDFAVYIDDIDPDVLTLSVTGNTEVTVDIAGTIVTFGAAENWNGTETLIFTVDDNQTRATASDSVDVIVTPVNDPPVLIGFSPEELEFTVYQDSIVTFNVDVVDIDSDLNYAWFVNTNIQTEISETFVYQFSILGEFEIKSEVTDEEYQIDTIWDVYVEEQVGTENLIPTVTELRYNYPNPFNPETTISFSLAKEAENAEIIIYNLKGQKIKTLECGESLATIADGVGYSICWDGTDENNLPVGSGIYLYQLKVNGNSIAINKMILMK